MEGLRLSAIGGSSRTAVMWQSNTCDESQVHADLRGSDRSPNAVRRIVTHAIFTSDTCVIYYLLCVLLQSRIITRDFGELSL